jgi:AraC family transcriptional regulator, melibiose operon regulatory protein
MEPALKLRPASQDERKSLGFGAGMGEPWPMRVSHAHGDLELNYVYRGGVRYFMGGKFVEVPANCLAVFWAAMPHQVIAVEPGTEFMWINVPLVTLLRWDLGNAFMRRVLAGEVLLDGVDQTWDADFTRRWLRDLTERNAMTVRTVELEVEARLRRLAFQRSQKTAVKLSDHKNRQRVEAITAYLAFHYRDELTIKDVGEAVGMHPNYAMTTFRKECGMSIWQYLIRLRLSHAQLMLLSTDKTVLAIALESGFGSLARFYAAFTRECGMAPAEYRKRAL